MDNLIRDRFERFILKVREMRSLQIEYQKYHVRTDLEKLKRIQRQVDKMIPEDLSITRQKQIDS